MRLHNRRARGVSMSAFQKSALDYQRVSDSLSVPYGFLRSVIICLSLTVSVPLRSSTVFMFLKNMSCVAAYYM